MSTVPTLESYINRITSEYRNQPNFVAYVTALIQPLIDSQALLRSLLTTFDLDTAIGVQLDAVGQWIGRSRYLEQPLTGVYFSFDTTGLGFDQGTWFGPFDALDGLTSLDDTTYRALLYAKRIMNNWDGTIPGIASAIAALLAGTSPGSTLSVVDNQDMSMTVAISGQVPPAAIIALLQGGYVPVVPSGVGPNYLITSVNLSALFGFDVENSTISGFDVGAFAGAVGAGPGPVSGFALVSLTATTATFSWLPPAAGTGPFTYQLQDQVDAGIGGLFNLVGLPVSTTTATIAVSPGHSYAFQVYAINSSGPGTPSATLDFSTPPATNVSVAAIASFPVIVPKVTASVHGFTAVGVASLPGLSAAGTVGVFGHALAGRSSVAAISAAGTAGNQGASARVTIATIAVSTTAGQAGFDFVAASVPLITVQAVAAAANPGGFAIIVNPIAGASHTSSFVVTGTITGQSTVQALVYIDDPALPAITGTAGTPAPTTLSLTWNPDSVPTAIAIPSTGVTLTTFSFTHPALPAGTHTITVTNGTLVGTASYTVS